MQKIVLASSNAGKVGEFQAILKNCQLVMQDDYQVREIEETGLSFVENAILKARNASQQTQLPAIADDSGLIVDELGDAPGIYSARYSGGGSEDNIDKLLNNMQDITNRTARFYCAIVVVKNFNDPTPIICEASWKGEILLNRIGNNGFGYDSVFFVPTHNCSSAQLSMAEKNKISHRGKALQKLRRFNLLEGSTS